MTGLWNLTRALNNDNPSKSKTAIEANNELITKKRTANVLCRALPGTKHHTCCPRAHQTGQRGNREHHSTIVRRRTRLFHDRFLQHDGTERCLEEGEDKESPWTRWNHKRNAETSWSQIQSSTSEVFNYRWMKGVVPVVWKEAMIIPVSKQGKDKKNPHIYRPISLISCVGKLLERIVNRRLINHLESNSVLSPTHTQDAGSSEAQRTNLPTLPRTSKMHSRRKRSFWQSSSISQMHLTRSGKRNFS